MGKKLFELEVVVLHHLNLKVEMREVGEGEREGVEGGEVVVVHGSN